MNLIYARDIQDGCTITQAGYYQLAENISWNAPNANARAITIACDNVTIDFAGFTLSQINTLEALTNTQTNRGFKNTVISGNVGVWAENYQGITIKNGNVLNIQGVGICLRNCKYVDLLDLNVRNCGKNGVVDTSFLYRNGGIFVMGTSSINPDEIIWSSDIRMINCVCSNNTSELDFVVTLGSLVQNCENIEVKDCIFNATNNTSPEPSGVQFNVVGIDFVMCRNVLVENCEAHDNTSGGEPAGFFAWGENYKFVNCRAHRNFTLTGHRACGFNISTTAHLEMINCEANGNYNANPQAASDSMLDFTACGFRLGRAINRALIKNCHATGNYSVGKNAPVAGFMLNSAQHVIIQDCSAIANRSASGNQGGKAFAAGFMASTTQPCNSGQGYWGGNNNSFINCIADGNTVNREPMHHHKPFPQIDALEIVNGDEMTGAGFILENQEATKIIASHALNNNGIGIWLRNSHASLIEDNYIIANSRVAIYEENNETKLNSHLKGNLIINNKIRMNGASDKDDSVLTH